MANELCLEVLFGCPETCEEAPCDEVVRWGRTAEEEDVSSRIEEYRAGGVFWPAVKGREGGVELCCSNGGWLTIHCCLEGFNEVIESCILWIQELSAQLTSDIGEV